MVSEEDSGRLRDQGQFREEDDIQGEAVIPSLQGIVSEWQQCSLGGDGGI